MRRSHPRFAVAVACLGALVALSAEAATIRVTNPSGSEPWVVGQQYTVTWVVTDVTHPRVRVDLLQGATLVGTIAGPVPTTTGGANAGSVLWALPSSLGGAALQGTGYRVRVATTNQQVEGLSRNFEIRAAVVQVAEPPDMVSPDQVRPRPLPVLDLAKLHRDRCDYLARLSVGAQVANQARHCGFTGPEWTTDHKPHFDWCMARIFNQRSEVEARPEDLLRRVRECRGTWDVDVTLTRLEVHDDCDNVSDGDWYVALHTAGGSSAPPGFTVWPGTDHPQEVDTGDTVQPGITNRLVLQGDTALDVTIEAIDCDGSSAAWILPLAGVPVPPIMHLVAPYETNIREASCDGEEEWWEYSGGNDYLGYSGAVLQPPQWTAGGDFTIVAGEDAKSSCGSDGPPFTATVRVSAVRRP